MKKKVLFCSTLAVLFISNSFALDIHQGKVLSHKEWSTNNVKAIFKDVNSNKTSTNFSNENPPITIISEITSKIEPTTATTSLPAIISSTQKLFVRNQTTSLQHYSYSFEMCTWTEHHDQSQCAYYDDEFELQPNGYAELNKKPELHIQFTKAGSYMTWATAYLWCDNSTYSSSTNTINITDGETPKA